MLCQEKRPRLRTKYRDLFLFKLDDIRNLTVKHITERIQRLCADCLTLFDAVQCVRREALLEDQMIFCYALLKQRFVKRLIADHFSSPIISYHTQPLDYTHYFEYYD